MLDVHIDYPPSHGNGQLNNGNNDEAMAQDHDEDDDDEGTCEGKPKHNIAAALAADFYSSFYTCFPLPKKN